MIAVKIESYKRYDLEEVATIKGVDLETVRRWIEHGMLPALKIGSRYLVRGADLFLVGPVRTQGGQVAVVLENSQLNAPGNDNENLNQQYICLQNRAETPVNMSGWLLRDAKGATYTFPSFELQPGTCVLVHTGNGTDTDTDLYWGRGSSVWCNEGDTVSLYDRLWGLIDQDVYEPSPD